MFMNNVLMLLMNNILVMLVYNILVVLMNYVLMVFLNYGLLNMSLDFSLQNVSFYLSWYSMRFEDWFFIMPYNCWSLIVGSLYYWFISLVHMSLLCCWWCHDSWLIAVINNIFLASENVLSMIEIMMLEHLLRWHLAQLCGLCCSNWHVWPWGRLMYCLLGVIRHLAE